jgi:hypothetical protein
LFCSSGCSVCLGCLLHPLSQGPGLSHELSFYLLSPIYLLSVLSVVLS